MKTARNITKAISFAALLVTALASLSRPARSQEAAARYSKMAAVDQYLMTDRSAEIAMARSAAPPSISADAEVMVLGRHGYETVVKGKNGFVCLVELRSLRASKRSTRKGCRPSNPARCAT